MKSGSVYFSHLLAVSHHGQSGFISGLKQYVRKLLGVGHTPVPSTINIWLVTFNLNVAEKLINKIRYKMGKVSCVDKEKHCIVMYIH